MKRVLEIFKELSAIPHGSGNMEGISAWCEAFANGHGLWVHRDERCNVIIRKSASPGYEDAPAVMLQGHLDMVCQKDEGVFIDFEKDGITLKQEGDFLSACGTTLGADNGIALAMSLAILERDDLAHPALEVVFTTDEEIGMVGATQLDMSLLRAKKMINLDSEEDDQVTVSCAGGSDFIISVPLKRERKKGVACTLILKGLQGGHSGVEIHKGRVNADLLAGRFLQHMASCQPFSLISVSGGDKANAIPLRSEICFLAEDAEKFCEEAEQYLDTVKKEIATREPGFSWEFVAGEEKENSVIHAVTAKQIISALTSAPNGVMEMSADIPGLVETSLNLGILQTGENELVMHFALRSNLASALYALEEKLSAFAALFPCHTKTGGHYPPWEYREVSSLRSLYQRLYEEETGEKLKIEALHAGLECGVFAAGIPDLDCIAIGPTLYDVHTTGERMSISSAEKIYGLLIRLLKECR